jgi:hypothetical protein
VYGLGFTRCLHSSDRAELPRSVEAMTG